MNDCDNIDDDDCTVRIGPEIQMFNYYNNDNNNENPTRSISVTFSLLASSSRLMAAACSSAESSCNTVGISSADLSCYTVVISSDDPS